MRIAILMTNTDRSAFAAGHPGDGAKFGALLAPVCPGWEFPVWPVCDDVFPPEGAGFDGVIITGSPASVHDAAPWVARLMALIRALVARGVPIFGACFGHQAVALALGGRVGDNPDGWVLGRVTTAFTGPMAGVIPGDRLHLYAAHREQVLELPPGADVVATTPGCPLAGFTIGQRVLTTQYHPEMTPGFIAALVEQLRGPLGNLLADAAAATLAVPAQTGLAAGWIAAFFRQAAR